MNIIELSLKDWIYIDININWLALVILIILAMIISLLWKKLFKFSIKKSIVIEEMKLGIGDSSLTLKYNRKDQEIAYKLWVELNTRKVGLMFEPESDVISEVYNSWYVFFGIARELMKDIPIEKVKNKSNLVELTGDVLNKGLRPHLTKWQAKYRKWYEENKDLEEYKGKTPQEIQRSYPLYSDLETDLLETNRHMIEYKKILKQIAYEE